MKARRLRDRESADVKRILREKLNQPHLRDLARNPMQLAILLSLIHTRGTSLPDKRTALYDSYVELFFNREAEKSDIVRDNRDLLVDIHRYLAWLLHTEAELGSGRPSLRQNGSIEESRLKQALEEYLIVEGHHDPALLEKLFSGVVERVVALVSRVQGTYEFEVQPLREYFAARYLYETAPYSPVGNERRGTKPDRFDALARNFYWLNVTRFYAGCYSKGELASLIDRLGELARDSDFRYLSHPRVLAATLLSDWVFTQHPKSVGEVIGLVLDGLGLRFLLASSSRRVSNSEPFVLPAACGKQELVNHCIFLLRGKPSQDYALDIVELLRENTNRTEISSRWLQESMSVTNDSRTEWLRYGLHLGCLSTVDLEVLRDLLSDSPLTVERVELLLRGRRADIIEVSEEFFSVALENILGRRVTLVRSDSRLIESFCQALNPERYRLGVDTVTRVPLSELWNRATLKRDESPEQAIEDPSVSDADKCRKIVDLSLRLGTQGVGSWSVELSNWDVLVGEIVVAFGPCAAAIELAAVASSIRSSSETCVDTPELFDWSKSLCRRARYARLRAGTPAWWTKCFQAVSSSSDRLLACLLWFTWASPSTISQTSELVNDVVEKLPIDEWNALFDLFERTVQFSRPEEASRKLPVIQFKSMKHLSPRVMALLWFRGDSNITDWETSDGCLSRVGNEPRILKVLQTVAIRRLVKREGDLQEALKLLARSYSVGVLSPPYASRNIVRHLDGIPGDIAKEIVTNAQAYPSFLVAAAEKICRGYIAEKIRPVSKIAEEEGWFR